MSTHTLTRRGFLGAAAGVAGAAACTGAGVGVWQEAFAKPPQADETTQVHTTCDGCGNKCGMIAYTRNGEFWRLDGELGHPSSQGSLCVRGRGLTSSLSAESRLTAPLKNVGGKFEEVSWDDALADISSKISGLGSKLAVLQARGNCEPFAKRFAAAMGTPNYFTDAAIHDIDYQAAIAVSGGAYPTPDVANAKYILLLGKSSYDGSRPAEELEIAQTGAKVVLADARMSAFGRVVDEWLPIIPGTELALLMGIAQELIRTGNYDKKFLSKHANGFSAFESALSSCSLTWASEITGLEEGAIGAIAAELANNAPAAFVDYQWGGYFGAAYKNSFDTCRMVYLLNAMLGNFNEKGGLIFGKTPWVTDEMLAKHGIPAPAAVADQPAGADTAQLGGTSCVAAIQAMQQNDITAAVMIQTNPVVDYPASSLVKDAIDSLQFLVVMDEFMTDTAQLADYVLPLASYLECGSTPTTTGSETSVVALRNPVIERQSADTKSIDEAITALANACGKTEGLGFSLEAYNKAWCAAADVNYEGLVEQGTSAIAGSQVKYGTAPYFTTASGKLEFAPEGIGAPQWTEPEVTPTEDNPRLLIGQQALHTATATVEADKLMEISKMYELDAAWINAQSAQAKGINNNDKVKITTSEGSITVTAKVTNCISPYAIWMPVHYGNTSAELKESAGFGASPLQLIPQSMEPKTGAAMACEVLTTVEKAGA